MYTPAIPPIVIALFPAARFVQQDVQNFDNHKQLHPTVRTQISTKDVKLVALP